MSEIEALPEDTQHYVEGEAYKIGSHGYTYVWRENDWRRTSKKLERLRDGYVVRVPRAVPKTVGNRYSPSAATSPRGRYFPA